MPAQSLSLVYVIVAVSLQSTLSQWVDLNFNDAFYALDAAQIQGFDPQKELVANKIPSFEDHSYVMYMSQLKDKRIKLVLSVKFQGEFFLVYRPGQDAEEVPERITLEKGDYIKYMSSHDTFNLMSVTIGWEHRGLYDYFKKHSKTFFMGLTSSARFLNAFDWDSHSVGVFKQSMSSTVMLRYSPKRDGPRFERFRGAWENDRLSKVIDYDFVQQGNVEQKPEISKMYTRLFRDYFDQVSKIYVRLENKMRGQEVDDQGLYPFLQRIMRTAVVAVPVKDQDTEIETETKSKQSEIDSKEPKKDDTKGFRLLASKIKTYRAPTKKRNKNNLKVDVDPKTIEKIRKQYKPSIDAVKQKYGSKPKPSIREGVILINAEVRVKSTDLEFQIASFDDAYDQKSSFKSNGFFNMILPSLLLGNRLSFPFLLMKSDLDQYYHGMHDTMFKKGLFREIDSLKEEDGTPEKGGEILDFLASRLLNETASEITSSKFRIFRARLENHLNRIYSLASIEIRGSSLVSNFTEVKVIKRLFVDIPLAIFGNNPRMVPLAIEAMNLRGAIAPLMRSSDLVQNNSFLNSSVDARQDLFDFLSLMGVPNQVQTEGLFTLNLSPIKLRNSPSKEADFVNPKDYDSQNSKNVVTEEQAQKMAKAQQKRQDDSSYDDFEVAYVSTYAVVGTLGIVFHVCTLGTFLN